MGIRTGEQYIEALKYYKFDLWIDGERVDNLVDHPVLKQPIREVAALYDLQHDPNYQDLITHRCSKTGERVSNAFLKPKNYEDLRARHALFKIWAEKTYGLLGRSPDFLNVTVTSLACNADYLAQYSQEWAENIKKYYNYLRDNDLFLTHAIINPQNDRSKASHEQIDPYMHLGVVKETDKGLIVRGAKMLATHAPITDEVIVYPFPGLKPGDERHALAFAIPNTTPGLRILCREKMQNGQRSLFDHPLSSRFEELDAVLIFNDVLIPWERVFLYGNVEAANNFYPKTGLWQQPAHQTAVRASVKLSLATAIAIRLADAIGVDKYLHVQQMLGELVTTLETVKGLISAAEHNYEITPSGEARPSAHPLEAIRGIMPTAYARAIEVIQTIGAGGLLMMPTAKDYNHPELKKDFDRYFGGRAGISAEERIALFKLAWDLCGEAFGQRLVQYERYYAGDPVRMTAMRYLKYPKEKLFHMVDQILAESREIENNRIYS